MEEVMGKDLEQCVMITEIILAMIQCLGVEMIH